MVCVLCGRRHVLTRLGEKVPDEVVDHFLQTAKTDARGRFSYMEFSASLTKQ